jgi:hypothetical protein
LLSPQHADLGSVDDRSRFARIRDSLSSQRSPLRRIGDFVAVDRVVVTVSVRNGRNQVLDQVGRGPCLALRAVFRQLRVSGRPQRDETDAAGGA